MSISLYTHKGAATRGVIELTTYRLVTSILAVFLKIIIMCRRNAVAVLERWWIRVRNRKLFSTIKHAICAAVST